MVVAHGCNIFHPCHNPACVVVVVTKLLLLLICVIKVVPTIASGSGVSLFFGIGDQILRILHVVFV